MMLVQCLHLFVLSKLINFNLLYHQDITDRLFKIEKLINSLKSKDEPGVNVSVVDISEEDDSSDDDSQFEQVIINTSESNNSSESNSNNSSSCKKRRLGMSLSNHDWD